MHRRPKIVGATLVELAFTLPILMMILLFIIWYALLKHAQYSLQDAVTNGPRLAISVRGRGLDMMYSGGGYSDQNATNIEPFKLITKWKSNTLDSLEKTYLAGLLASPDMVEAYGGAEAALTQLDLHNGCAAPTSTSSCWIAQRGLPGVSKLRDLPNDNILSLIYSYESIRVSLGKQVRYPCDPEHVNYGANDDNGKKGAGCVLCMIPPTSGGFDPVDRNFLRVRCAYQVSDFVVRLLAALISSVSGGSGDTSTDWWRMVISRTGSAAVPIYDYKG